MCVTVTLDTACSGLSDIYSVAYLGSYDPNNIGANYLADSGNSPHPNGSYSFSVPAGATYVVVVHELNANGGCAAYTLTVNNCAGGPTSTPVPPTSTSVPTNTPTNTATNTATNTPVPPTNTGVPTNTAVPTNTPTRTADQHAGPADQHRGADQHRHPHGDQHGAADQHQRTDEQPRPAPRLTRPLPTNTPASGATPRPGLPCAVLPADNIWNRNIAALPVHAQLGQVYDSYRPQRRAAPRLRVGDVERRPDRHPVYRRAGQPARVPMTFTYDRESDPGPYPVPTNAPIQGGPNSTGDRHVIVVDQGTCTAYELFKAYPNADGSWRADAGAEWPLTSNALRPDGWTSADAAGLPHPARPGAAMMKWPRASSATRSASPPTPSPRPTSGRPATPTASSNDPNAPPMGLRLRLKANVDISGYGTQARVVLQALKDYGMILADTGTSLDIGGIPNSRWNDNVLHALEQIHGTEFEVVDESGLMVDPNSGQSR